MVLGGPGEWLRIWNSSATFDILTLEASKFIENQSKSMKIKTKSTNITDEAIQSDVKSINIDAQSASIHARLDLCQIHWNPRRIHQIHDKSIRINARSTKAGA